MAQTQVAGLYAQVKSKVVGFDIRPGERLNEGALAAELGVSRTPLRAALNRLVAERLVEFRPGAGFFCRTLEAQAIFDLYEMRQVLEVTAVRLAVVRASDAELAALRDEFRQRGQDVTGLTIAQAAERDEAFHIGIARASGNAAIVEALEQINDRIRFIRWVRMAARVGPSKAEHRDIIEAMVARRDDRAADAMSAHIGRRMDQVIDAVKEGISNIYMAGSQELLSRVLEDG